MSDPSLMEGWRARLAELRAVDMAEADDPVGLMVARLAADGLWLADVCGLYGIDDDMRRRIAEPADSTHEIMTSAASWKSK